jgi:hypothetical protein
MRMTTGAFPSRRSPRCSVRYVLQSAGILPNRFRNRILCDVAKIFKNLIVLELDFFAKVEAFYLEPILELFDFRKELRVFDGNGCSIWQRLPIARIPFPSKLSHSLFRDGG